MNYEILKMGKKTGIIEINENLPYKGHITLV